MNNHLFVTLAAAAADQQAPSAMYNVLMIVAMVVIFYVLLLRPQQKQAKEKAAIVSSVKTGDKVVMVGGMYGIIANVKETTVLVKVADNVKLEFDKSAIATVIKPSPDA